MWRPFGALVASVGLLLLMTEDATASTYGVHECTTGQGMVSDARVEGETTGYTANNTCGQSGGGFLQMGTSGVVGAGTGKAWAFRAPLGTRINRALGSYVVQGQADHGGHRSYFFYREDGDVDDTLIGHQGAGNVGGMFDSEQFAGGPLDRIGVGVHCNSGVNCPNKSGIYSRIGDLELRMEDTVAPGTPALSGPALNGWITGSTSVSYSVADQGAGVYVGNTAVNGTFVHLVAYCTPEVDGSGFVKVMKPCPATASGSSSLDTSNSAFVQGDNSVRVCVYEYGDANLQSTCATEAVKVDSIAPAAPTVTVVGGEGWRRDNEFALSLGGQAQGSGTAPVVGAQVRISGPGGYDQTTYYPGNDIASISGLQVPTKGDYTAQVYLRDAAGNESSANASTVHLRFDNTVPEPQRPDQANGWISRSDLADGYLQRWEPVPTGMTPPSGIAGYRVVINTSSDTDPCSGGADPRACGAAITDVGAASLSRTLHLGDLTEGANYVHVVPISGSGMRATVVKHTPLKADFSDPVVQLQGDEAGEWINHDANLAAVASDAVSGMTDTAEFPGDDPPATFIQIDGQTFSADAAQVSQTLSDEGSHDIQVWARDLAGNTGSPVAKTVRIDKTAPSLAFTNTQDPDDPDKLVAPVNDSLSGVVDGTISYRQASGEQWKALETTISASDLVARVDSGDLEPGVTYEFRAQSHDAAGNIATSTSKQNGEPMTVTGPFRAITSVADLRINGKAKARVKYGKGLRVTGELVTEHGKAVANAAVELQSAYFGGSKKASDVVTATTDANGGFSAVLPKGPGRVVVADYKGDLRHLGVRSGSVKANVKSKVTLKVPRTVDSDKGIVFTGRVLAKGTKFGKRGKRLEIQVQVRKKWKTVGKSIRTNKRGKFKLAYRFTADYPQAYTFHFRAAVLKERGFPYLPSKSKKRSVTVTP